MQWLLDSELHNRTVPVYSGVLPCCEVEGPLCSLGHDELISRFTDSRQGVGCAAAAAKKKKSEYYFVAYSIHHR